MPRAGSSGQRPSDEVHAFVNDLEREAGTYLYGRRMYETMAVWEVMPLEDQPAVMRDYAAIWRAADKIVYSSRAGAGLEQTHPDRARRLIPRRCAA